MSRRRPVTRWTPPGHDTRVDTLAVEEPLEIRLDGRAHVVTMRTPGHDLDLALGFLVGEGIVRRPDDVRAARHCPDAARDADGRPTHNVIEVDLVRAAPEPARPDRTGPRAVTSACGVCGSGSIEDVRARAGADLTIDDARWPAALVADLPARLRRGQRTFERTGGVHAAGLFDAGGRLLCLREDVGRHNAVDKVVGWALQQDLLPLRGHLLQVSGRASFELVQKAWLAGVPALAAVSAPSSLAVELAEQAAMTLVGFSRGESFNVYCGAWRVE